MSVVGKAAWVGAWVALGLGPVHALSRYATVGGAEDLDLPGVRAWAEPAARVLEPLLSWSDPQTVYVTYGKLWLFIVGAATACAFMVRRSRAGMRGRTENVGWWIALTGGAALTVGLLGAYWTPWLEESFNALVAPGLLISVLGSLVLGIGLLLKRAKPAATAWLLIAYLPTFFVISDLVALGAAMLAMLFAWGIAGRRLTGDATLISRSDNSVVDLHSA